MKKSIAIIGAGLAGLTMANKLAGFADVKVFEKSRGIGGRMSTRYAPPYYFDHGAQFFTARDARFRNFIDPFIVSGDIAEWKGKVITLEADKESAKRMWFEPHYVASPNMNNLCKKLSENLEVVLNTEIAPLVLEQKKGWNLLDKNGDELGAYDWVVSTAPPAETERLFGRHFDAHEPLREVRLLGCYTLMIGFNRPWDKQWIAAIVRNSPIQWLAVNSTKPGRDKNVTCLVAHSTHDWAEKHIDDDMQTAQAYLVEQLQAVTGISFVECDYLSTHRWRYANLLQRQSLSPYKNAHMHLASVGDWCAASRVEDVWLASDNLASSITDLLNRDQ